MNRVDSLRGAVLDSDGPVRLFDRDGHSVWWVGSQENTPFRCNAYLIVDGDQALLFDPGSSMHHFEQVRFRVGEVLPPERVTHIVLHHQDPDLCDSLPDWVGVAPKARLVTTPRARVLLPYYGLGPDVEFIDVSPQDRTWWELPSGHSIGFMVAPFLHFPEAMVTWDEASRFLLSGDIGAAIEQDWRLVADDLERHWAAMVPFHAFYMASSRALGGFIDKIAPFDIDAVLPQHGSILPGDMVREIFDRLRALPCGVDLVYPRSRMAETMQDLLR